MPNAIPTEVSAPADAPFTIHFNNKEAVPHNVAINDASGGQKFNGELITGHWELLIAGSEWRPWMDITLTKQAS